MECSLEPFSKKYFFKPSFFLTTIVPGTPLPRSTFLKQFGHPLQKNADRESLREAEAICYEPPSCCGISRRRGCPKEWCSDFDSTTLSSKHFRYFHDFSPSDIRRQGEQR